ncbi:transcription initiation factor IIB, partial [Haloferax volcanii]
MATRDVYERQFDESCGKSCGNASCLECGGQVITDAGERRCESCGLIIDGHGIDRGPEWRSFERKERKRVGAPRTPTRHDHGLATEIGRHVDANGTPIPGERRQQLSRLRTQHSRSRYQSSRERRLAHGLDEVRRLVGALDLPDSLRDQACRCFRSAQQADLLPGRSIEAVAAASVHAACRCAGLS